MTLYSVAVCLRSIPEYAGSVGSVLFCDRWITSWCRIFGALI